MLEKPLSLKVRNRQGNLFDGKVTNITSFNDAGEFDILPKHSNFIAIIKDKLIIRKLDGETKEFEVDNGVVRVRGNQVDIFLGVKETAPTARISAKGEKE